MLLQVNMDILNFSIFYWRISINERRIYRKSTNKEKALICMKKIFSSLEKLGYPIIYGETIKEYLERLKSNENFEYDNINQFIRMVSICKI